MAVKNIYGEKKKEKNPYGAYGTAAPRRQGTSQNSGRNTPQNSGWNTGPNAARTQSVPQSDAVPKPKRKKSPSELGEEVVRTMLEDFAKEEQQKQAAADRAARYGGGAAKARAADGSRKTTSYHSTAAPRYNANAAAEVKTAAGKQKAAPYGGATGQPGGAASYGGAAGQPGGAASYGGAAGQPGGAASYGGAAGQPISAASYSSPAAAKPAAPKREKTPSELGDAVVAWMLVDEGIMDPKDLEEYLASFEEPSAQTLANAGMDGSTIQTIQLGDTLSRTGLKGEAILHATDAGQAQLRAQAAADAGLDENAVRGAQWKNDFANAKQWISGYTDPIRATPEWQALETAQDLAYAGLDGNAQWGFGKGEQWSETHPWLEGLAQLASETHLAQGMSVGDYLWDKFKSGMWTSAEGAWNGIIDLAEADARNQMMLQNFETEQYALLGGPYREYADLNNARRQEVIDGLPEVTEGWRSHKAAEHAQRIDEMYDAGGFLRIGGDIVSGVGQIVPTALVNIATGGTGGMAYLYASASGNAAARARAGGADSETSLLYGMLSGAVEVLTEQLGGGIPGLNKGVLDDWLMGMAESNAGRAALKHVVNALGEGAEEFISAIADAYLSKMWNGDKRGFLQTLEETLPDAFYEGFVGTMTSACMSVPGNFAEMSNAHTVDVMMNVMRNGEIVSDSQLAKGDRSMQSLVGVEGAESPWSRLPLDDWINTKNMYLDGQFSQAAGPAGNAVDLSGIDTSNLILFPTRSELEAWAKADAEANAGSDAASNSAAARQNGQLGQKDFIPLPMFDRTEKGPQTDASETASKTSPLPTANDMSTELSPAKSVEPNTLQTDPTAETASPEMVAGQNARIRQQALEKGKAKGIELDTAEKLMEVTGLKLRYIYEEGSGVDGFISGDTVTVNLASDTSAFRVAAHEAGHSMKLTDAGKFEAFQTSVQRIIESNAELKQYAEQIRADYTAENSPARASLMNADGTLNTAALEEDVCLKTFERLIEDPERLVQAVAQDRSAIESFLDVLRGIKNSLVIKFTGSEKAMLDEAERTLVNLLRGEAGTVESERFSIQQDLNGKPYVQIDTNQQLFEGKSDAECIRIAEKYMKEHFQGRPFDVGDSRAFVNGRSVGEYTHPANYRLDSQIKRAKINASTELDNLLAVSEFLRHENDDGRHADATNGWDVYQTTFVLNGEVFTGEVKLKITDRGKLFYDITHIEKAARID